MRSCVAWMRLIHSYLASSTCTNSELSAWTPLVNVHKSCKKNAQLYKKRFARSRRPMKPRAFLRTKRFQRLVILATSWRPPPSTSNVASCKPSFAKSSYSQRAASLKSSGIFDMAKATAIRAVAFLYSKSFLISCVSDSTCDVCGNISTGCISFVIYPNPAKSARSLARVAGLHDT